MSYDLVCLRRLLFTLICCRSAAFVRELSASLRACFASRIRFFTPLLPPPIPSFLRVGFLGNSNTLRRKWVIYFCFVSMENSDKP